MKRYLLYYESTLTPSGGYFENYNLNQLQVKYVILFSVRGTYYNFIVYKCSEGVYRVRICRGMTEREVRKGKGWIPRDGLI